MDPLMGAVIGGGSSIISNLMGNQNAQQMQQQAEQFNQSMVQQQENYQTQMSNTAYQRASADMKAAGLNPMMMFGSGSAASSPAGASTSIAPAQKTSALSGVGSAVQSAASTAVALKTADATVDNLIAENANLKATYGKILAETGETESKELSTTAEARLRQAALPSVVNAATTAKNEMDVPGRRLLDMLGFGGKKADQALDPIANIISSASGAVRARNAFQNPY